MSKPRQNPKPGRGYDFFGSAGYGYNNAYPNKRKIFGLHNYQKGSAIPTLVKRPAHGLTAHLRRKGMV